MSDATILLLDNRDSFVWNLAQAFRMLGQQVAVVRSDRVTVSEIAQRRPRALVMSPGPGGPDEAGVCRAATRALHRELPILGVCLGHQVIAAVFGGVVTRGTPCHGKTSPIAHTARGLFRGLPTPLHGCRYHSLTVESATLPAELVADAWTPTGEIMGLHHAAHPVFGVQFHPESFRTEHGLELLSNFLEATR